MHVGGIRRKTQVLCAVTFGIAGALSAHQAALADAAGSHYFCVKGSYPDSWGVVEYSSPPPGVACYASLDALYSALNQPSVEFWQSLPTDVNTNMPFGGWFDAGRCVLQVPEAVFTSLQPGEVYWARCGNGLIGSVMGPPPRDGLWWAPPPNMSAALARALNLRVYHQLRVRQTG